MLQSLLIKRQQLLRKLNCHFSAQQISAGSNYEKTLTREHDHF